MPPRSKNTRRSQSTAPLIMLGIGVILVLGALIFALANQGNQQAASASNPDIPYPEVDRVTLADAKAALDQNSAIFVDVRDATTYTTSHVKGAVSLPLSDIEGGRFGTLDKSQWIITYCT